MNEIDWYVDSICNKFNESDKDIQILREELKSNLYDEAHELEMQGFSEDESIKLALENFGQENTVISEMSSVWKKKSDFTLMIVKVAIGIFIIGLIFTEVHIYYLNGNINYANSSDSILKSISCLFFSISWIMGCIAFYQYINIKYKSIILVLIAICDIGFGGFIVCTLMFPTQVKETFIILFGAILIIILAMKVYFIKNKSCK